MRKIAVVFICAFFLAGAAFADNLHDIFKMSPDIKVYLKNVTDASGSKDVTVDGFKKYFDEVLAKRINMKFTPVANEKDADVIVTAHIKSFLFQEKVLPRFYSAYAVVADTTAPKSLGKIVVDYKVIVPKKENRTLVFNAFTTEERRPVEDFTGEDKFKHTVSANIDRFIYRAFYKEKEKR